MKFLRIAALVAAFLLPAAVLAQIPPGGTVLIGGQTPVTGACTSGFFMYNNSGILGCQAGSGGGITFPQTVGGTTSSGGIPYFSSGTVLSSSSALAAGSLMIGGGAGVAPSTTTTGTGVVTALGIAPGTTGSFSIQDGAIVTGNCLKWGPGIEDAGAACGSGSGGVSSITTTCPSSGPSTGAVTLTNGVPGLAETGPFTPTSAQCGTWFEVTNATTATLPGFGGLPAGYFVTIENSNTVSSANFVTVTPTTGTISGAGTLVLPPNSTVGLKVNAAATSWVTTFGTADDILLFTTVGTCSGSGCYTPNPSLVRADVACIGEGGGGGGAGIQVSGTAIPGGGAGAAGASKILQFTAAEIVNQESAGTVTFTIPALSAGGAGATGTSAANGVSATAGTYTTFGTTLSCAGGGGGGGSGPTGAGGGGGVGMLFNGSSATANTASGGNGGSGGGQNGTANGGTPVNPSWSSGVAGAGATTAGGAGGTGVGGLFAAAGASGAGVSTTPTQFIGAVGGNVWAYGLHASNGGAAGTIGGGNGGNGATGLQSDGLLLMNGWGLVGGTGGGSGGSSNVSGVGGGTGGNGGFGSGGGGGGACIIVGGVACTGGSGGSGGGGAIEIWEHNH